MLPEFWESQAFIKTLYARSMEPVCEIHSLTRLELDILLFLANNPGFDTASDIVERRMLTKSHVSVSIKALELRGFLTRSYTPGNKKTAHLSLCDSSAAVVLDGRQAQDDFISVIFKSFSKEDRKELNRLFSMIAENIREHLKEELT